MWTAIPATSVPEISHSPAASLAAFPARDGEECRRRIDALFPGRFGTAPSVLELDLQNINAVLHPPLMVCNAGWIEATGGEFAIYGQGAGPATARVVEAVDAERMALADRLAVPTLSLLAACAREGYTAPGSTAAGEVGQALRSGPALQGITAPATLDHRYLHEDVGWGLVQWLHLASVAGVPVPTMEAITTLAGVLTGVDYRASGLTLEAMGLAEVSADDMAAYAIDGAPRRE